MIMLDSMCTLYASISIGVVKLSHNVAAAQSACLTFYQTTFSAVCNYTYVSFANFNFVFLFIGVNINRDFDISQSKGKPKCRRKT